MGCGSSQLAEGPLNICIDVCDEGAHRDKESGLISIRQCPPKRQLQPSALRRPPPGRNAPRPCENAVFWDAALERLGRGQNKSSAKSYAKGERSMNCAVVRKPRHPIPVDCHRIGPDLISSSARLDNSPGRLVVRGVGRWVNGSFSRLKID